MNPPWQTDRTRSASPPGSRSRQTPLGRRAASADGKSKEVVAVSQLEHRLMHMLQVEPVQRRELVSTCADGCLRARARACENQVLLRWALTCFHHAATTARHAVQLESSQDRLTEMQDRLRRAEQRALCSEERLFQSEDIRRREKARLCKAELDQRRSMEWRRDYEARSPAAARAVAIAILSASFDGFVRGVTTLVLTVWASLVSRMRRARTWKDSPACAHLEQLENASDICFATPELCHGMGAVESPRCVATPEATDYELQETPMGVGLKCDGLRQIVSSMPLSSRLLSPRQLSDAAFFSGVQDCTRSPLADAGKSPMRSTESISGPGMELSRPSAGRHPQEGTCVWVDDEATEHLSEALANWQAWRQHRDDPCLLLASPQFIRK